MNVLAPVSTIMNTQIIAVSPDDTLNKVKEVFDKNNIHHLPVVRHNTLLGIISKSDFLGYFNGLSSHYQDRFVNNTLLNIHKAEEIMTTKLVKLEPTDRINVAIDLFLLNRFHALPVVVHDDIVGIVTTFDIMKALSKEKISDADYVNK